MRCCFLILMVFLFLLQLSCLHSSSDKKMPILIYNNSNLDLSNLDSFSCKNYLSPEIYANPVRGVNAFDKNAIFINQHPNGFTEQQFSKLTVTEKNNDSLWINIEVFRILHSDTLRVANFGGRTISLKNYERQVKDVMCRFFNK